MSPSNPTQQDPAPPVVSQGAFQTLLFFESTQPIHEGEPSHWRPPLHVVPGQEMFNGFQLLHALLQNIHLVTQYYYDSLNNRSNI